MKKKIGKLVLWFVLSGLTVTFIVYFEKTDCTIGTVLTGALIGIFLEKLWKSGEDVFDTADWKTTQRKMKRGGLIKDDTIIRISFAYLYRIKVEDKYLLVKNSRNTGKYQPVGGVYKLQDDEENELKKLFHVIDDDKIMIDESSRNDYRLRVQNRYLRKFVKRFNSKDASRERVSNIGREFREELLETGLLNWEKISYRYCGRYMTDLRFNDHFQTNEIHLYDIVELIPTLEQEKDLKNMLCHIDTRYTFVTTDQILHLGISPQSGTLVEWISDHSKYTIQEEEPALLNEPGVGDIFEVEL